MRIEKLCNAIIPFFMAVYTVPHNLKAIHLSHNNELSQAKQTSQSIDLNLPVLYPRNSYWDNRIPQNYIELVPSEKNSKFDQANDWLTRMNEYQSKQMAKMKQYLRK